MIHNKAFVEAVEREQKKREETQAEFAQYLGISQGVLSKFYTRGIRDGVVIRVLAKFPYLAHFFVLRNSNEN